MASILADIGTKVGQELKALGVRLSSAETAIVNLGGQQPPPTGNLTIAPVVWTNLTEISFAPPTETGYELVAIGTAQAYIKNAGTYNGNNFSLGEVLDIADYNPQNQSYKLQKKDGSLGFYWRVMGDATWGLGVQPISSGGSVQVNGNGGIEKISGTSGFNTGASSTDFIEGNSNGYVQFQWATEFKSLKIGLTYQDVDYSSVTPFELNIDGNGHVYTNGSDQFSGGTGWATQGDYFRIRHYASDNSVRFQRRQEIFQDDADFGQDYVTFHTHSVLANGNDLYVDTSLYHVGSRLNDVLLAR